MIRIVDCRLTIGKQRSGRHANTERDRPRRLRFSSVPATRIPGPPTMRPTGHVIAEAFYKGAVASVAGKGLPKMKYVKLSVAP